MSTEKVVAAGVTRGRRALFVRRGLVALAAGVLAGVSVKTNERTAYATDGNALLVAANNTADTATSVTQLSGAVSSGNGLLRLSNTAGIALFASTTATANAIRATSTTGAAIFATSGSNAALWGSATSSIGLIGQSSNATGIFATGGGGQPGSFGVSATGPGVRGDTGYDPANGNPSGNTEAGVLGASTGAGPGVRGTATGATGVRGESSSNYGLYGTSSTGVGAFGISTSAVGVWGESSSSIGVYGNGSTGVSGNSASGIGVSATTSSGVALRANGRSELYGDVEIGDFETQPPNGSSPAYNLNVTGELRVNGQKLAIVRGGDGEYRKFYSLESAECYFEDFGTVKMSGGHARVDIAADFSEFVDPARGFYIQLTPLGASNGLYVSGKDLTGFDISEANGGTSQLEVQYRIVARRADVPGDRLARVNPTALRQNETAVPRNHTQAPQEPQNSDKERRRSSDVSAPPRLPAAPTDSGLPSAPGPERRSR
ncbi:MAG: hypothetical protein AB7K36_31555 [Chloroflexota bacterium]